MRKRIIAILTVVLLAVMVLSSTVSAEVTPAWSGSIQATVVEPLVVKIGSTVLDNGYTFQPVTLKVSETKIYTLTVTNTGATTWLVKPISTVDTTKVTAVWNYQDGRSIASGESKDFVLTLTGITITEAIPVAIGFTRE